MIRHDTFIANCSRDAQANQRRGEFVLLVQGAFVGFFLYLRARAKRIADLDLDEEWSELQRGPRTS